MSDLKEKFEPRNDVIIEGQQARFQLAALGAINGTYAGEFVFRCFLTPTQQIAANREYRELLGANPTLAEEHISYHAYCLSQLRQRIISAPPFWTATKQINGYSGDIPDEEVITQILDAAIHAELKYKHSIQQQKLALIEKSRQAAEKMLAGKDQPDEDEDFADEDED